MSMTTQTPDAVREALRAQHDWHYEKAKALSKQPQTADVQWRRNEHREQIDAIAFALSALDSRAGDAGEGDRYTQGYAQGQADADQLQQWMQDKAWQDTVLMLVHYQTLAERTWLVGHEEAAERLKQAWAHARALSETKSAGDIGRLPKPAAMVRIVPQTWIDRAMQIETAADGLVSAVCDAMQRAQEGSGRLYAANIVVLDERVTAVLEAINLPEPPFATTKGAS